MKNRMHLKSKVKRRVKTKKFSLKNIRITAKGLFIFLLSFSVFSLVLGITFYVLTSSSDKEAINEVVQNNFDIKDSYNYLKLLQNSILENTFNVFLIWILGISVIGLIGVLFIYFCEMFSIGFTIASIISTYKIKGIFATLIYLIPSKILYVMVLFILTFYAIKMSYLIIRLCFSKDQINIKNAMNRYFKVLVFSFFVMIGISMLKVFVDPIFIKLFTKL